MSSTLRRTRLTAMAAPPVEKQTDAQREGDPEVMHDAVPSAPRSDQLTLLRRILDERLLRAHFQPILGLRDGAVLGFEGLIRGPADSPLHLPVDLFRAAVKHGLVLRLERLCRLTVVQAFAQLALPQRLFLNVRPQCLALPGLGTTATRELLRQLGVEPERIVIELTEHLPVFDFASVRTALTGYRALGFQVAIDDLGEGFASFRLWDELRPQYVKADMHFVQGIDRDPLKLQFLKSIQQIARTSGSLIIAEGIETAAELEVVRDLGIPYGQGYFIARPAAEPPRTAPDHVLAVLQRTDTEECAEALAPGSLAGTAECLLIPVAPVGPATPSAEVLARFEQDAALHAVPVVEDGKPVGLIERHAFQERFVRPFRRELFGRKPCSAVMDANPLVVEQDMTIQDLSERLALAEPRHLMEGFILTHRGRYAGLGTGQDLMREMTRLQVRAARYANPLTLLPGNVPINEHIERLLQAGVRFTACYCDLDHFKPFNDVYGYRRGDDVIQLAARILAQACDGRRDFLGHVGGDDFVLLLRSPDWAARCAAAVQHFGADSADLYSPEDLARGGLQAEDRKGNCVLHPLLALSIGAVAVEPREYASHYEVSAAAAAAKRQAKRLGGGGLFIERRRPGPPAAGQSEQSDPT
jgi:EAL domain-containing protein (putative c-di-GMP-specific phosphodiesterase class I)/GGDEF domain-containing protein